MSTATEISEKTITRHMPMYRVLMHNDDKTTFDFVIAVLIQFFNKKIEDAINVTKEIHEKGVGLAGVYALEHAEFKQDCVHSTARAHKFPLMVSIEPAT